MSTNAFGRKAVHWSLPAREVRHTLKLRGATDASPISGSPPNGAGQDVSA